MGETVGVTRIEGALLLSDVAERALQRQVEFFGPELARVRELGQRFHLPATYQEYLLHWSSDDFERAGLTCDGAPIRLADVESFVELQSILPAPVKGRVVIAVADSDAPLPGRKGSPFRQGPRRPAWVWVLDVEGGEVLRLEAYDEPMITRAAPSFSEFLKHIALETAEAMPPCHPFARVRGGDDEPAFDALTAAVGRLARVVERRIGRPPAFVRTGHALARTLSAKYGLPSIYRRFLETWSSRDFVDTGLSCKRVSCWIEPVDGLEFVQGSYRNSEGWPSGWVVIAIDYEGCYILDLTTHARGDCAVLFLNHGEGLRANRVADSFVGFLERVAEDSAPAPDEAAASAPEEVKWVPPPGYGAAAKARPAAKVRPAAKSEAKPGLGWMITALVVLAAAVLATRCG
jgi:hypothetical protein